MSTVAANGTSARRLCLQQPADPAVLRGMRRRIERWAAQHSVPDPVLVDLQLAVGEAVSNGVEHAYRDGDPGSMEIELELHPIGTEPVVEVRVTDHGRWRPIPFRKGFRGRGLAIIDQLSRGLTISSSEGGTQLSFTIPLARRPVASP